MTPGGVENGAIELAPSSKSPILTRDRVSSPSRSHFSPGLKLILRTQVTNPEIATFQSFSKGVYDWIPKAIYKFSAQVVATASIRGNTLILFYTNYLN